MYKVAANGENAVLSAQSLRLCKGIWFLADSQLSRGLRSICVQRDFVQSRIAQTRRDVCYEKSHAGSDAGFKGEIRWDSTKPDDQLR